jgi:tRNA (guanosine-2'-O-)-methyltransferase
VRRDDPDVYEVTQTAPLPASPQQVIDALGPHLTERRRARIEEVARRRTLRVTAVLEELADPHNASAVLRSADAFGVQQVHALAQDHQLLAAHKVSKGTHRWLDVMQHRSTDECVQHLHDRGYRVAVATMNGALRPEDLAQLPRVAVVFGNEHRGASQRLYELADDTYAIPMHGFAESLNVSVAAAITLYTATAGRASELTGEERAALVARFMMASVRDAAELVRQHLG